MPRLTLLRRALLAAALAAAAPAAAAENPAQEAHLHYDARVAWLDAGRIAMDFAADGRRYELSGEVVTSGAMNRFFRWQGRFAATGAFADDGMPRTRAYLLLEDDGRRREVLLAAHRRTAIHVSGLPSREVPVPPGVDLMSLTFLAPHCIASARAHDGEKVYALKLLRRAPAQLDQPPPYYAGPAERCDYRFQRAGRSGRSVSVWMPRDGVQRFPVLLRVRVPVFPDGVLRARVRPEEPGR